MNPHHLATFLAVARCSNLTRAGREIGLSQPAVSRHIRELEEAAGILLLDRIGRSVHLTEAGRVFVPEAEAALGALERLAELARAHREAEVGRLRIGASTVPGLFHLPPLLAEFHRRYPGCELHYVVSNSEEVQRLLVRNEIDLGYLGGEGAEPSLRFVEVARDRIVPFVSSSHPLAARKNITAPDLRDELWILRERGSATRELFLSRLAELGGTTRRAIELTGPVAVRALVAAGVGISFTSLRSLRDDLARDDLVRLPIDGLEVIRPILRARHVDKVDSVPMQRFLELAEEFAEAM